MAETDSASFMDQCRIVCLSFFKEICTYSKEFSEDDKVYLQNVVEKEMEAFECSKTDLLMMSKYLAEMSINFDVTVVESLSVCADELSQQPLYEDSFCSCIAKHIAVIEAWEHVSQLLVIAYKLFRKLDHAQLVDVVDLTARYLRSEGKQFVEGQGGWKLTEAEMCSSGILSSIVMVDPPHTDINLEMQMSHFKTESIPPALSPPESPPFSLLPGNMDDEERDSLNSATPPEMVERPPMTASLMQMMGGGEIADNGNTGASSDSSGFEMVAGSQKRLQQINESTPEPESTTPQEKTAKENVEKRPESSKLHDPPVQSQTATQAKKEEGGFSDYIPHISVGVAAAAACIGFLVLRNST